MPYPTLRSGNHSRPDRISFPFWVDTYYLTSITLEIYKKLVFGFVLSLIA